MEKLDLKGVAFLKNLLFERSKRHHSVAELMQFQEFVAGFDPCSTVPEIFGQEHNIAHISGALLGGCFVAVLTWGRFSVSSEGCTLSAV